MIHPDFRLFLAVGLEIFRSRNIAYSIIIDTLRSDTSQPFTWSLKV